MQTPAGFRSRVFVSILPAMRLVLVVLAVIFLGLALQVRDGLFDPAAMWLLTGAFVCCAAAVVLRTGVSPMHGHGRDAHATIAGVALVLIFFVCGVTKLHYSPNPHIDTFVQNRDSCAAI